MRTTVGLFIPLVLALSPASAQDAVTLDFGGRIGVGWLATETASNTPVGFGYEGFVLRAEGNGTLDFAVTDGIHVGAAARMSLQEGQDSTYYLVRPGPPLARAGDKFDRQNIDLALYMSLQPVTLSFGEMQTAFEMATPQIGQGNSILDGANAVWLTLGDGSGSTGSVDSNSNGPGTSRDYTTLRADVALADFVFTVSQSREASMSSYFDASASVRSAGLFWSKDIGEGSLFVGTATERGPAYRFDSTSVGWTVEGLKLAFSRIHRMPLELSSFTADYELKYFGLSASYEFGPYSIGFATSSQSNPYGRSTFEAEGRAFWLGWQARDNVSVNFEVSQSDYRALSSQDTRKASLAVSMEF